MILYFGDYNTKVTATVSSDSSLQFTVPSLPYTPNINVIVYVENLGNAGLFVANISLSIDSFTPLVGSRNGDILTI